MISYPGPEQLFARGDQDLGAKLATVEADVHLRESGGDIEATGNGM